MCGICGFTGYRQDQKTVIERMMKAIEHRGLDSEGSFCREKITLGFRRLSIIDLEDGQQPMESADGNLHIVFNGEIYDYKELRAELEAFGISFCTHSDTEVLINTIQLYGEKALNKLRGMFGFAVWNEQEQSNMNIGTQILKIRKEKGLTQEEFGKIFHVTRQTVSNWENEKSYPNLQILIDISNRFDISLDVLIKEDVKMVKTMDKERVLGSLKREKSVIDFFTGAGTGIVISCLFSADTMVRTVTIVLGVVMIGIGWYREAKYDKRLFRYMNNEER